MSELDLDARTAVLETRVDNIEHNCERHNRSFEDLNKGVQEIKTHIAKQNGALPRIEENTRRTALRLDQFESMLFSYVQEEKEDAVQDAIRDTRTATKTKLIWGGLVFAGGIALTELVRWGLTFFA